MKKNHTPPFGGLSLPALVGKRDTKKFGSVPQPEIPEPRPELDSSPTPVFEMGYRDLNQRFLLLASRFDSHATLCGVVGPKLNIKMQKECRRIADNIRKVANRVLKWSETDIQGKPKMSPHALAAEKSWAAEQFLEFIKIAQEIMGEKPNLNRY